MALCDHARMTKKTPSKSARRSSGGPAGKAGTGAPPARGGHRKGGPGNDRGAAKKSMPGWLPGQPPRGTRQPSLAPVHGKAGLHDPYAEREAARYEQPIASREMILGVLSAAEGPMEADALAAKLSLTDPERFDALASACARWSATASCCRTARGGFAPAAADSTSSPAAVIANPDGFGFLRPDAGGGDDLFLPPYEMRKVMHGDRVLASVTGVDRRGRREGAIVEVLERRLDAPDRPLRRSRTASATSCPTTSASSATC